MEYPNRKRKANLIRSLIVASATTTMIATGGFGTLPENNLTADFQQVVMDIVPHDLTQYLEPYLYVTPTPGAQEPTSSESDFPLSLPIGPSGRDTIDPNERFGQPQKQQLAQNGVDFVNSAGTLVLAAAPGRVLHAGADAKGQFSPSAELYGLVVVMEHSLPGYAQSVYTLYAHLSQVDVEPGQQLDVGETLGLVGSTGHTTGSELHFEVRYGENTHDNARNPELWLIQFDDDGETANGALAGRILDENGDLVDVNVVVQPLGEANANPMDLHPYVDKRLRLQPPWGEAFAVGNLPPGEYKISFALPGLGYQSDVIEVVSGRVTEWEWVKSTK